MAAPSVDIKDILVSDGIGTFTDDIHISKEPASPDNVITIYDTGGQEANPKWSIDRPSVMIRVRNNNYLNGYSKCKDIKDSLLGLSKQTINSTEYIAIWLQGEINFIEYDDNNRAIFTLNFNINREPPASGNRQSL